MMQFIFTVLTGHYNYMGCITSKQIKNILAIEKQQISLSKNIILYGFVPLEVGHSFSVHEAHFEMRPSSDLLS